MVDCDLLRQMVYHILGQTHIPEALQHPYFRFQPLRFRKRAEIKPNLETSMISLCKMCQCGKYGMVLFRSVSQVHDAATQEESGHGHDGHLHDGHST